MMEITRPAPDVAAMETFVRQPTLQLWPQTPHAASFQMPDTRREKLAGC